MHELGITQEIVEIVTRHAEERRVKRVVLEIGKLSSVLPDSIRFCFELCAAGTCAESAELEILEPPGIGCCRQCGARFELDSAPAICACGSGDVRWSSGEQLNIKALEVV